MKLKWIAGAIGLAAIAALVWLLLRPNNSSPPIKVDLQINATPAEQTDYVLVQLGSSRFKYLAGKAAGIEPRYAQKLTAKVTSAPGQLHAELRVNSRQEAERYVTNFLETLQMLCGTQAQVALSSQTIR